MADSHEDMFAEEAQEEAVISSTYPDRSSPKSGQNKNKIHLGIAEDEVEDLTENNPLLPFDDGVRKRQQYVRAGKSYERAINEPWTGAHGAGSLPWHKKPSIYWLLPAFFPFCVAIGGLIVPRTYLILNLICKEYLSEKAAKDPSFHFAPVLFGSGENPQCRDYHVQRRNAWFNAYTDLISGIFSAIVTPHIGAWSDRIGRKKVIVIASMGALVNEVIFIAVGSNPDTVSIYWILLGAFADGICGSFTSGMALAFSYASDTSSPENRATAFGYFQGTLFAGIALGPIIAGILISWAGNVMIMFYVALACHVFFILFTALLVPESLSEERQVIAREKYVIKKAETADDTWIQVVKKYNLFEPLWILRPTGEGSSPSLRKNLVALASIDTMMFGVAMGTMRIILIYAEFRFGWDALSASIFISSCNVLRVSCLVLLLPLLNRMFRGPQQGRVAGHRGSSKLDINIIRGSIVFDLIGYLGYAIAPVGAVMVVSGLIASVGGIGSPTLASSITKHVPPNRTGQVMGALGLLHALSRVVAPTLFNVIYGITVGYYSGIVFFCLASIFLVVFALSWQLKPNVFFDESIGIDQSHGQDSHNEETNSI